MGFFNSYTKPGKGISKEDLDKTGFSLYFDIFLRRFWKFISLNLMYIVASIPAIIISSIVAYYLMNVVIGVKGITINDDNLVLIRYLLIPFTILILQITGSGPASVAKDYILKKYVKDTHVWMWSDFVSSFKGNFLQGMLVYVINIIVFFALSFSFLFYRYMLPGNMAGILSKVILVLGIVFFIAQKYIYNLVASFELKTKHVYKNAFLLAIVGLKWNLLSLVYVVAMMVGCGYVYSFSPPIAVMIILSVYFSIVSFTQLFMTRNVVGKHLEEPALELEKQEKTEGEAEEN